MQPLLWRIIIRFHNWTILIPGFTIYLFRGAKHFQVYNKPLGVCLQLGKGFQVFVWGTNSIQQERDKYDKHETHKTFSEEARHLDQKLHQKIWCWCPTVSKSFAIQAATPLRSTWSWMLGRQWGWRTSSRRRLACKVDSCFLNSVENCSNFFKKSCQEKLNRLNPFTTNLNRQ